MRLLLGHLKAHGFSYRWGTPHRLVVRCEDKLFFVRCPADVPELFEFLAIPRFQVPEWLQPWPTPARRRPRKKHHRLEEEKLVEDLLDLDRGAES